MDYVIRTLTSEDEPILWEMLYEALHTSETAPPREIVKRPELARYVEGWGDPGDLGFVAHDTKTNEPLGAVWIRSMGDATPELAFAVKPAFRRHGIGAALLTQLVKSAPEHSRISIQAPSNNPAVRLYERFGFKIVDQSADSVVLRREA